MLMLMWYDTSPYFFVIKGVVGAAAIATAAFCGINPKKASSI